MRQDIHRLLRRPIPIELSADRRMARRVKRLGVVSVVALGLWFWYRLIPVPVRLDDPYSSWRWALIGLHVTLIVAGWGLVAASLLAG